MPSQLTTLANQEQGRQAHLGRGRPCSHGLNCLLLLVLFLLKLLGQFQVAKAQHALGLLLLQG